jgi:hypothetical protein
LKIPLDSQSHILTLSQNILRFSKSEINPVKDLDKGFALVNIVRRMPICQSDPVLAFLDLLARERADYLRVVNKGIECDFLRVISSKRYHDATQS